MQNRFSFMVILTFVTIAGFTLFGCGGEYTPPESFDYYLRESWVSIRDPDSWLWETEEDRGRLVIGYDSITISGSVKPFDMNYNSEYTKNIALKGYSEESSSSYDEKRGTIYIRDSGTLKSVPYLYWRASNEYMLTVGTAPNEEKFRKE
ncbi:hypothetical protein AGMMS4952_27530 [Spirochaetia bacterium]|nr:hypothetical protein AGMMS4952_27530 [Spirochaetia bacterium]